MDPTKVQGVADWPPPRNPTDVRSFLGFTGFYRYFIPKLLARRTTTVELDKEGDPLGVRRRTNEGVRDTKVADVFEARTTQPQYDKPFVVHTDASAYGVGAILLQAGEINPKKPSLKPRLHPIAYYSATFTPPERNYDIYERGATSGHQSTHRTGDHTSYIQHTPFMLITDPCQPHILETPLGK